MHLNNLEFNSIIMKQNISVKTMGLFSLIIVIFVSGCTQSVTTPKTTCEFNELVKDVPQFPVCSIRVNIDSVGGPDYSILSIDGSELVWNTNFKSIMSKYSVGDEVIVKTLKREYKLKIVSDECGNNVFEYPLEKICK